MAGVLTFITENWLTILVCILLAAAVIFALEKIRKNKGACNGDCANCQKGYSNVCDRKTSEKQS